MSGRALSEYCGFLNQFYEFISVGDWDSADCLSDDMDLIWEDMDGDEREQARQHAQRLSERYAS